jgi:serpin B
MRNLSISTALLLNGWAVACTGTADIATQTNSVTTGGGSQIGQTTGGAQGSTGGSFAPAIGGATQSSGGNSALSTGGATPGTGGNSAVSTGGATAGTANTGGTNDVAALRSTLPPVTTPDISDSDYATFISGANTFGLALGQNVTTSNSLKAKNSVFSPTSAQIALAMTYGGAVGNTAAAMKTTLGDNLASGKYHAGCNRLLRDLASRNSSYTDPMGNVKRIELTPTNSLWVERTMSVKSAFLDLLSQQYDSGMWAVDFIGQPDPARLAINAWVSDHTHSRINDLLQSGDVNSATRFVLVNALYLYASWSTLFDKRSTASAVFHTLAGTDVSADTLHSSSYLQYKSTASFDVLELPYFSGDLWMTIVLPQTGQFEATRSQISGSWISGAMAGLARTYVTLALPKFTISTAQLKLAEPLKAMGMGVAFDSMAADFSGISNDKPLYLSDVIQKAFIGVDEDGTEAAAATAVFGSGAGLPPPPTPFIIDRPFLFFIQDTTGLVVFSGQVVDPTL